MSKFGALIAAALGLVVCAVPAATQGQGGTTESVTLPDGAGSDIVQSACTSCHGLQMLTFGYHDHQDWQLTMDRMVAAGAQVPADRIPSGGGVVRNIWRPATAIS